MRDGDPVEGIEGSTTVPQTAEDAQALFDALDRQLARVSGEGAWDALVAAGVVGLAVPEELGGLGLSVADAAPVFRAIGAHGLAVPYLETAVVAAGLLATVRTPAGDGVLRAVGEGARVAVAGLDPRLRGGLSATPIHGGWRLDGDAPLVVGGDAAAHILMVARTERHASALLLVAPDAEGMTARRYPTIDGRGAADLRLVGVAAELLTANAEESLTAAGDAALACIAVEAAALMRRLVDDTVAFTKDREQFGQPISRF